MLTRRLTWTAYALMFAQGYLIYGISYMTPYMESELGAPTWASAFPNALMASGFLAAGVIVPFVIRRLGPGVAIRLWAVAMGLAALLLGVAGSFVVALLAAFVVGAAGAGIAVHTVSAMASQANGMYIIRATLWSTVGGLAGPIILSLAARTTGWNTGVLLVIPITLVVAALIPPSPASARTSAQGDQATGPTELAHGTGPVSAAGPVPATRLTPATRPVPGAQRPALGRAYRLTWLYMVLSIGVEFAFVAWGTQLTVARTGMALADATALGSLFVAGTVVGRAAWSTRLAGMLDRRVTLRLVTVATAAGAALLWVAGTPVMAGVALFIGGVGISVQYPVGASLALAHAPGAPVRASSMINMASGIAISGSPLLLGFVASGAGIQAAWTLILGLVAVAFAVILAVPAPAATAAPAAPAP